MFYNSLFLPLSFSPSISLSRYQSFSFSLSPSLTFLSFHLSFSLLLSNYLSNYSLPLHPYLPSDICLRILDTPEYQRLAKLKQLGTCVFVFRGATHTRLEHSVGVSHLAEKVARTLQSNQPELGITEADVTCVR